MLFLILFSLFLPLSPEAWSSDYHSPRTAALGGSGHAGPLGNDAIYLNPSYSSFLQSYSVSGGYSSYNGDPHHGRLLNVSILDGRSPLFQAGVGYTVRNDGSWLHIGASKAFVQRVGFGMGGKLILDNGKPVGKEATMSVSGILSPWLQVSAIADNLLQTQDSIKQNLYREFIIGTKIIIKEMMVVYADPHVVPDLPAGQKKIGLETGLEFTLFKDLFLRTGYFTNGTVPFQNNRGRGVGMGLGWVAPRMTIDYAFQRVIRSNVDLPSSSSHVIGTTLFF